MQRLVPVVDTCDFYTSMASTKQEAAQCLTDTLVIFTLSAHNV